MKCHVEGFQLMQLGPYGIEAKKNEITPNLSGRVILYPEKGFKKKKWHYENFVRLYYLLKSKGIDVHMLKSIGLETDIKEAVFFEELGEVKDFFKTGGIFVSNDSGMAHLAGICGLHTITIFNDFDPGIWRPRGNGMWLQSRKDMVDVPSMETRILEAIETAGVIQSSTHSH
jgi:ADP-heptose:LPS heptosyltransferase